MDIDKLLLQIRGDRVDYSLHGYHDIQLYLIDELNLVQESKLRINVNCSQAQMFEIQEEPYLFS